MSKLQGPKNGDVQSCTLPTRNNNVSSADTCNAATQTEKVSLSDTNLLIHLYFIHFILILCIVTVIVTIQRLLRLFYYAIVS